MDNKKLDRVVKGVVKSRQAETRRAVDKQRMVSHERATKDLCVIPRMPVLDRSNP
jgi:hypothetical protein